MTFALLISQIEVEVIFYKPRERNFDINIILRGILLYLFIYFIFIYFHIFKEGSPSAMLIFKGPSITKLTKLNTIIT